MARSFDSELPRSFGPFTLLRRIAAGGMAEVFVASARGLGGFEKLVAIKLIHARHSEDEEFVRMLVDEAKLSVLLTHANIAQSFDLGVVEGRYFLLMEYVEGADASRLLKRAKARRSPLPIGACLFIVREVLNALDYAHTKHGPDGRPLGLVHRDVSPQNVLLGMAGEVKLADFGIAKAAMRSEQTAVGIIKGKYCYMSPEQAWADRLDARSDVFSAGLLLRELLTGETLYEDEDELTALLDKVRKARIPAASASRKDVPADVDAVLAKALARSVDERFGSAQDFATAVERLLARHDPTFGTSRLARLMGEIVESAARSTDEPAAKATARERLPKMISGDFLDAEDHSVLFALRRSSIPPAHERTTLDRPRAERTAVARPQARGALDGVDDADDEEEATTFFQRGDGTSEPALAIDDATVIDSNQGLLHEALAAAGLRASRRSELPMLLRDVARAAEFQPPRPNWKPVPFVGPSFDVAPLVPLAARAPFARLPRWALAACAAALGLGVVALFALLR